MSQYVKISRVYVAVGQHLLFGKEREACCQACLARAADYHEFLHDIDILRPDRLPLIDSRIRSSSSRNILMY